MEGKERSLKEEIINTAKKLYGRSLAVAASGNISARLSDETILISCAQAQLAELDFSDIVKVDTSGKNSPEKAPSSELSLHSLVYQNFKVSKVLHCHPPLANGYFAVKDSLLPVTFEARFYLGGIPVIRQQTPTVTKPQEVVEALKASNIVVLKNHGVVAVGDDFSKMLSLVETLEEAIKSAVVAEVFKPREGQSSGLEI